MAVDQIYEAAFIPGLWDDVLKNLASLVDAEGALLFCASDGASKSIVSEGIVDLVTDFARRGWSERNVRAARLLSSNHAGFLTDNDLFDDEELAKEPMYHQFLRPWGFGFGAATAINVPSGEKVIISLEKKFVAGPVTTPSVRLLDTLRPHLARSAMIAARLSFERVSASLEALDATGLASAVLTSDGKVVANNSMFESYAHLAMTRAREMGDVLRDAGKNFSSVSFPLPRASNRPPAVAHIIPIRGYARDIFSRAAFFLLVTPVDSGKIVDPATIQSLFDLSPAEAKVAHLLAAGHDAATISTMLSVSMSTVRTHIKAILSKSELSRQSDFVAAVVSIRPPGQD